MITEIRLPTYDSSHGLTHIVNTSDTSGSISTQYFGNKFNGQSVEREANFAVYIRPSKKMIDNNTFTLHIELEKVSMNDLIDGYDMIQMIYETIMLKNYSNIIDFPINKSG